MGVLGADVFGVSELAWMPARAFDDPAALLDGSHRSIPVVGIYNLLAVKARVEAAKRGSSF
jgi:hypothetical protein